MKKIYEKMKKVFESKVLIGVLYGVGTIIVVLIIFSVGVSVGFHKASFGRDWGNNYSRNFGADNHGGPLGSPEMMDSFPNAHGVVGKIIKIALPTVIVADRDNLEKSVLIADGTKIQRMRDIIAAADLKVDDLIVVIGSPSDQGQIEAKFIRIMPSPDFLTNNNAPTK